MVLLTIYKEIYFDFTVNESQRESTRGGTESNEKRSDLNAFSNATAVFENCKSIINLI